ncbi:MAG: oligosaccharide flippase family protein [Patescibacteria group bacterium]
MTGTRPTYPLFAKMQSFVKTDLSYFIRGGFWINSNYVFGSILSLVLSMLFAHYVSKDIFGIYKYIISIASVAAAFSLTGMNVAVMRSVAQGFDGIFKKSLIVQFKWSLPQLLFVLAFSAYYFFQGNSTYGFAFLFISVLSPLSSIANTYNALLNGKKDFKTGSLYGFFTNVAYFIVMTIAILSASSSALILAVSYFLVMTSMNVFFCIRIYKKYEAGKKQDYREEDISYGKHMSLMGAVGSLASQLDNILLYHLLGPATLALYSFATIIPERIRSMFGFISTLAFPKIAEKEESISRKALAHKILQLLGLSIVIAGVYALTAPFLYDLLFPQYSNAVIYSQIFALSLVAIGANISSTALQAQRRQKELYYLNTIAPILKIVLTVVGIWYFGIWGAIISKLLSYFFLLGFSSYLLLKNDSPRI